MSHYGFSSIKVLYIEDEPSVRASISKLLKVLGYETISAENGKIGVDKAKSWQPDLVLTDLRMPVMDGFEVIRRLRNDPDMAQIPIFVLTSYLRTEAREKCLAAGADRFFAKPIDIYAIDLAIQEALTQATW